jgi:hypothetical protein
MDKRERELWAKIMKSDGCWVWTGCTVKGYGTVHFRGRKWMAHRLVFELLREPVPDGMQLDHLCRNPSCVNPDHLEIVTSRENTLRGIGPSAKAARSLACPRGHLYDAIWSGSRRCKICHREHLRRYRAKKRIAKLAFLSVQSGDALRSHQGEGE